MSRSHQAAPSDGALVAPGSGQL